MHKTGEYGGGWYRTLTWHHSWTGEKKKAADYSVKEVIRLILGVASPLLQYKTDTLCFDVKRSFQHHTSHGQLECVEKPSRKLQTYPDSFSQIVLGNWHSMTNSIWPVLGTAKSLQVPAGTDCRGNSAANQGKSWHLSIDLSN